MGDNKISEDLVKLANEAQQDFFDEHKLSEFFCSGHYHEESMRATLEAVFAHLHGEAVRVGYRWRHSAGEAWQYSDVPCGWEFEPLFAHPQPAELSEASGNSGKLVKDALIRALKLARNRIQRLMLECPHGSSIRDDAGDWAGEATDAVNIALAATGKQQVGEVVLYQVRQEIVREDSLGSSNGIVKERLNAWRDISKIHYDAYLSVMGGCGPTGVLGHPDGPMALELNQYAPKTEVRALYAAPPAQGIDLGQLRGWLCTTTDGVVTDWTMEEDSRARFERMGRTIEPIFAASPGAHGTRKDHLLDRRNRLMNSYGNGDREDAAIDVQIVQVDAELALIDGRDAGTGDA